MPVSQLQSLLNTVGLQPTQDGWLALPDSRTLTLQIAHAGVALTISRVQAVREQQALLEARTSQGELHVMLAADVFSVAVEGPKDSVRKAGFV
jgi:hypothetical protein